MKVGQLTEEALKIAEGLSQIEKLIVNSAPETLDVTTRYEVEVDNGAGDVYSVAISVKVTVARELPF